MQFEQLGILYCFNYAIFITYEHALYTILMAHGHALCLGMGDHAFAKCTVMILRIQKMIQSLMTMINIVIKF